MHWNKEKDETFMMNEKGFTKLKCFYLGCFQVEDF